MKVVLWCLSVCLDGRTLLYNCSCNIGNAYLFWNYLNKLHECGLDFYGQKIFYKLCVERNFLIIHGYIEPRTCRLKFLPYQFQYVPEEELRRYIGHCYNPAIFSRFNVTE